LSYVGMNQKAARKPLEIWILNALRVSVKIHALIRV